MSFETDRIEADVNASRHRLNDTLEALGQKLSPGQMLDEALGLFQGQAGQFAGKLGRQVRDNPLPSVLIAAGIGMLLVQSRQRHDEDAPSPHDQWAQQRYRALESARWSTARMADDTDDTHEDRIHQAYAKVLDLRQAAGEAAHDFKARVSSAVADAKHAAIGAGERVKQALGDAKHFAQDQAERAGHAAANARHKAEDFYNETPLAAGALALAVGALVGGAAPLSRPEREALGPVADKAARAGVDLANKAAQAGANLAERGAKAVDDSLDRALH